MYEFLLAGTDIFVCLTLLGRNTPLMHLVCLKFKPEEEPVLELPARDACVVVLCVTFYRNIAFTHGLRTSLRMDTQLLVKGQHGPIQLKK